MFQSTNFTFCMYFFTFFSFFQEVVISNLLYTIEKFIVLL